LINAGDADDVQGAEHDGFIALRKCDQHRVFDDGCILRVIDEKDIPAAAPNLERLKRRLPKKHSDLLNHGRTLPLDGAKTRHPHFVGLAFQRVIGFPKFRDGAGAGVGFVVDGELRGPPREERRAAKISTSGWRLMTYSPGGSVTRTSSVT